MIDELLDLIVDGSWHNESEIRNKLGIDTFKLRMVLNGLSEYDFVEYNSVMFSVRITPAMQRFWKKIKEIEHS